MALARKRTRRSLSPVHSDDDDHPPPPPPPQLATHHVPAEHEFTEGPDLQVIGETNPLDSDSDPDDDVPVRVLTDFSIYDHFTLELVPVASLLELSHNTKLSLSASGYVKAWIDNDSDEDDEDPDLDQDDPDQAPDDDDDDSAEDRVQRLRLTPIKRFSIHDVKRYHHVLDSNIYILTRHAWYILDVPSQPYKPFYASFWLQHRVLHLVVSSAISYPRITYDEFIRSLDASSASDDDVAVSLRILGRSITEDDVQSDEVKSYLLSTLEDLQTDDHIDIRRTPLFRALLGHLVSYEFAPDVGSSTSSRARARPQSRLPSGNQELRVLEHRNKTLITPIVSRVANLLFEQNIKLANLPTDDDIDMAEPHPAHPALVHLTNPQSVKWGSPTDHPGYYQSVCVDGVVYSIGDTVMVEPGEDENKARAKSYAHEYTQSSNSLANSRWFCRICYLFEDARGRKMFHGQWLTHSSKTLLQELGHSRALYLMLTDCEDIHIDAISQKCTVRELDVDTPEPTDGDALEENDFFAGLFYNSEDSSFVSLSKEQTMCAFAHCDTHQQCLSCGLQEMRSNIALPRILPGGGFAQHEFSYHLHDFIYVKSKEAHSVYKIGQIIGLKAMQTPKELKVRLFGRYDDVVRRVRSEDRRRLLPSDDRRLFKTDEILIVHDDDLQGQCYVIHEDDADAIDEWVMDDNHFYVNQEARVSKPKSLRDLQDWPKNEFKSCEKCHKERVQLLERQSILLKRHGRLRGLELFSGAGGLGTGFDLSGFVDTRWAIEFSPSAARTYQHNHPDATVYNQCTNLCLQHAIDTFENKNPKPLFSLDNNKPLPPMPKPGDVDFIYGGPPCQSFSLMNHNKKDFDIRHVLASPIDSQLSEWLLYRSTLPGNMLSYVEFYRPLYFLLENVYGLLCYKQKRGSGKKTITCAAMKFIQRSLASLGYQSKFAVLQAAQYGAPQGRKRVIIWGARRDVQMPEWPLPTHCSPIKLIRALLPTGSLLHPIIRNRHEGGLIDDRSAPLHFVTVDEAIGDLPPFDWINPHAIMKATAEDKREARERKEDLKIPAFSALETLTPPFVGFSEPRSYSSDPLTRYQKWLRKRRDGKVNKKLKYHYSKRWRANIAERVCAVPLVPGANQFSLPLKLRMQLAKGKQAEKKYDSLYKRLDADHVFATALTTAAPNHKGGTVLHPAQKRIITVRECARAQGFPDYYDFLSANDVPTKVLADQLRQIGNAVPIPLAYALGKALGHALFKMWDEEDREGSPEV